MCGRAHVRTGGLPFWNTFTDKGEVDFSGVHYKGKAHYYVMSGVNEPVTDFWYFTDTEGKPVQQGEGYWPNRPRLPNQYRTHHLA